MSKKSSVLFFIPDYHSSFILRDEMRKLGWRADVYTPPSYPEQLLYADDSITHLPPPWVQNGKRLLHRFLRRMWPFGFLVYITLRYRYFVVYGASTVFPAGIPKWLDRLQQKLYRRGRSLDLELLTRLGRKIIYQPSGCREQALQEDFRREYPDLCENCGWAREVCNDDRNRLELMLKNRYGSLVIACSPIPVKKRIQQEVMRYKSIDLRLWNPDLEVPSECRLSDSGNLRILHSFVEKNRKHGDKNIKGSPFVYQAVERLKAEGYPVEYLFIKDVSTRVMRFYQVQADIVVDQLIYGWWGSTGVETMALGKPVVCFLRPEWKEEFFKAHSEYSELPIVEANTETIYDVLKLLVEHAHIRTARGMAARRFAESYYDSERNAKLLVKTLIEIQ